MGLNHNLAPAILACFLVASTLRAESRGDFPELIPSPKSVELAGMSEPLPFDSIVAAALEFSSDTAPSPRVKAKILAHAASLREQVAGITSSTELGEMALAYLHSKILREYAVFQTRVDTAIETGTFNCVSSAVLYLILARAIGLQVGGVRTSDHAFCTIAVNGALIDVETTNLYGFNPGTKKEFTNSFGKVTGFSYVPPSNYRDRRQIGEKELLSLILLNRISANGERGKYQAAVNPAVSSYTLVEGDESRQAMQAAIANYATWLGMRREYSLAVAFLEAAKSTLGASPELEKSQQELTHNLLVSLIESGSLEEAYTLLASSSTRAALGEKEWEGLSIYIVQVRAERAARTDGFAPAADMILEGMRYLGFQRQLLQAYEAYVHNSFAQLYNARRFKDAKSMVEKGLALHPQSVTLAQDLELVEKSLR